MAARRPLIAANWKMHKTLAEAEGFCAELLPRIEGSAADVTICPSFVAVARVVELCRGSAVAVAAQNMSGEPEGAYTGEVSAPMLVDVGVDGVILGHSERRQLFGESDEALRHKVPAALAAGLMPILCVGETETERDAGRTEAVVGHQLDAGLADLDRDRLDDVVIAYEPVWAIGTGRTATPETAELACAFIRERIAARDGPAGERVRILYGGSVKPENATELLGREQIDGALVGGASLEPEGFAAIVAAAEGGGS